MRMRLVLLCAVVALLTVAGWSKAKKEKMDARAFIARSDAQYYYPEAHGVNDLVVDIIVDQFADLPGMKDNAITFYYAGKDRQTIKVSKAPPQDDKVIAILNALGSLSEFLMAQPSAPTFAGLKVSVQPVTRLIAGHSNTRYFLLVGKTDAKDAPAQEFHVLLDAQGLAYQLENVTKDGVTVAATLENVRVGNLWHIAKVTTRQMTKDGPYWKIETVTYADVETYSFPSIVTVQYRNMINEPVPGMHDITIRLRNFRVNTGAAAALLPAKEAPKPVTP